MKALHWLFGYTVVMGFLSLWRKDIYDCLYDALQALFWFGVTVALFIRFLSTNGKGAWNKAMFMTLFFWETVVLFQACFASAVYLQHKGEPFDSYSRELDGSYDIIHGVYCVPVMAVIVVVTVHLLCALNNNNKE